MTLRQKRIFIFSVLEALEKQKEALESVLKNRQFCYEHLLSAINHLSDAQHSVSDLLTMKGIGEKLKNT